MKLWTCIRGGTSLYGRLVGKLKLGNKHWIKLTDCTQKPGLIQIPVTGEIYRQLSERDRTGQVMGIRGIAGWRSDDCELVWFRGQELLPYEECSITEAFAELAKITNGAYDAADIEEWIVCLRGNSEQDLTVEDFKHEV